MCVVISVHKHLNGLSKSDISCIFQSFLQIIATPPPRRFVLSFLRMEKPLGQMRWFGTAYFTHVSEIQQTYKLLLLMSAYTARHASGFARNLAFKTAQRGICFGYAWTRLVHLYWCQNTRTMICCYIQFSSVKEK